MYVYKVNYLQVETFAWKSHTRLRMRREICTNIERQRCQQREREREKYVKSARRKVVPSFSFTFDDVTICWQTFFFHSERILFSICSFMVSFQIKDNNGCAKCFYNVNSI